MEISLQSQHTLTTLLANPTLVSEAHVAFLEDLIQKYPYYQPLHLLLAKASVGLPNYQTQLAKAALYNNGRILHQIINRPEGLINSTFNELSQKISENHTDDVAAQELSFESENEVFEEITEIDTSSYLNEVELEAAIFEEITEIDPIQFTNGTPKEETLVMENIVATDFFAFEDNFIPEESTLTTTKEDEIVQPEEYNLEAEAQTVSKYHDEKLPYTFLWWLAKTRKEHEQIFQPYVTQKKTENISSNGELQQQYVEHIFHLQTAINEKVEHENTISNLPPKGYDLIDNFIKNDPQIKAPKLEQINTENKAKKSAEDSYDLVSETLAAIYIEQMLYHKAIDTYEKLSLKFPEKSRYFADLIQSLEKKI